MSKVIEIVETKAQPPPELSLNDQSISVDLAFNDIITVLSTILIPLLFWYARKVRKELLLEVKSLISSENDKVTKLVTDNAKKLDQAMAKSVMAGEIMKLKLEAIDSRTKKIENYLSKKTEGFI